MAMHKSHRTSDFAKTANCDGDFKLSLVQTLFDCYVQKFEFLFSANGQTADANVFKFWRKNQKRATLKCKILRKAKRLSFVTLA